jgi:hypothetical protein
VQLADEITSAHRIEDMITPETNGKPIRSVFAKATTKGNGIATPREGIRNG